MQVRLSHGADLMLRIQGSTELPVHRIMLSARYAVVLARVLDARYSLPRESGISVKLLTPPAREAVHVQRDASDIHACLSRARVIALSIHGHTAGHGDPRLARLTADAFKDGQLQPTQALRELQTLRLARTPSRGPRCAVWCSSTTGNTTATEYPLFSLFDVSMSVSSPDVVLRLADRDVWTHLFVLRARYIVVNYSACRCSRYMYSRKLIHIVGS